MTPAALPVGSVATVRVRGLLQTPSRTTPELSPTGPFTGLLAGGTTATETSR